jgi:hypothetical protein
MADTLSDCHEPMFFVDAISASPRDSEMRFVRAAFREVIATRSGLFSCHRAEHGEMADLLHGK